MKSMMKVWMGFVWLVCSMGASGQTKVDEGRMEQDIEVAENILSTLIRQQFDRRSFMPMEVNGSYMSGYGVTFHLPQTGPFNGFIFQRKGMGDVNVVMPAMAGTYSYSYSSGGSDDDGAKELKARAEKARSRVEKERIATGKYKVTPDKVDSVSAGIRKLFLEVAKNFLADYGDVLSQLRPEERIVITNRGDEFGGSYNFSWSGGENRRSIMSVEAKREDVVQLRLGKISRDQFLNRLAIVNTESAEKLDPDLEVLSSMFSRLYREDLSKTYYSQGNVSYDRMKDFGVIYYMRVYSSNEEGEERWTLPTLGLNNVTQSERDKAVKDAYPAFESGLKENLVDYGRTLHSLKDDEQIMFNVKLTKCTGCGIPASIEVSVKYSALKDYNSGKATREATISKVSIKKVGNQ